MSYSALCGELTGVAFHAASRDLSMSSPAPRHILLCRSSGTDVPLQQVGFAYFVGKAAKFAYMITLMASSCTNMQHRLQVLAWL